MSAGVKGDPHPECLAELRELGESLRGPHVSADVAAMRSDARWQVDALAGQLRIATEMAAHATPAGLEEFHRSESRQPWRLQLGGTVAVLRANLSLGSAVCRHALRLAACVAICDLLTRSLHWERSYWAAMTAAIVLKPDFTTTLTRGVLRLAGTFAGLAVATVLFALLAPGTPLQILFIAAYMFVMRWAGGANYGLLVVPLTGLVVLLFAISGVPPAQVVAARGFNTLIGGLIALAANRLWPTWERTLVHESLAHLLDAYREYFQAVRDAYLQPGIERDPLFAARLDRARQAGRLARSNAEASAQRYRLEGGVPPDRITALQAILANSHRFIHAVMALEAGIYRSRAVPARAQLPRTGECRGYHALLPERLPARGAGRTRRPPRPAREPPRAHLRRRSHGRALRSGQCRNRPRHQQPEHPGSRGRAMGGRRSRRI